jgi:cytoskeletal protein CcmA (bactofilin family)
MAPSEQEFSTIIGPDARVKGEVSFESAAKLLGTLEGSVTGKGKVHVANGSRCKATVKAKEVAVEGHIEGNVEASDRVEIMANGRITGDVVAAKMNMAEGASINGYCRIGVPEGEGRSSSSSSSSSRPSTTTEPKPEIEIRPTATTPAASSRK